MTTALERIKGLIFGGNDDSTATAARPQHHHTGPAKVTAHLPARIQAGNLQMIGLQDIREAIGDAWPQRRESIHRIVDGVIRHRIHPGDVHYRLENDEYLVLFTQLTHAQARAKADAIATEAQKLLLGELPGCDIHVTSSVAEVDHDFVTSKVNSLEDLVQHVKTAGQPAAEGSTARDPGDVLLFGDEPVGEDQDDDATSAAPRMTGAGPDLTDLDQSLDCLFQKKTSAAFLKECQAAFYPNFSTKRRSFSFYTVNVTHMPTGRVADASDPMLEDPEELEFLLDRYRLTTALLGLHRMVTGGHRGFISIPVSFQTLAVARTRNIYLGRFKDLPAGLFRNLCITITNIPDGTPSSRIADAINYIQRFCASRILHIAPDVRLIDLYAGTGCQGFVTTLPARGTDPNQRLQLLGAFAKRAAWHKMESILWDISHPSDIDLGTAAGFNFLCGDAVAPQLATPGQRQALRADHIPQRAMAAAAV
jgi:hypothetical protein